VIYGDEAGKKVPEVKLRFSTIGYEVVETNPTTEQL
jgi:hypothetical protein